MRGQRAPGPRGAGGIRDATRTHPIRYNLHVDDVGHTLGPGATGSGKSFLLNFLVTHAQKYDPLTVIFDLGHSYRKLATLLWRELPGSRPALKRLTINPFALEPTPEHLHFLHAFVRVCSRVMTVPAQRRGGSRALRERREPLRPQRRTAAALHARQSAAAGARMLACTNGSKAAVRRLFDNREDTLTR